MEWACWSNDGEWRVVWYFLQVHYLKQISESVINCFDLEITTEIRLRLQIAITNVELKFYAI